MTRLWRLGMLVLSAVAVGIVGYDRALMILWVGHTDLEVEFVKP